MNWENFSEEDYQSIKEFEESLHHDVKAVEYFLAAKLKSLGLEKLVPFLHFGLTSEDINNLAYSLMLKTGLRHYLSELEKLILEIKKLALKWKDVVILGFTHGQKAVPTTLGKEFANYYYRFRNEYRKLRGKKLIGKLNGAVGNYNALAFAYPEIDWINFSKEFIEHLGLKPVFLTTQILPHEDISDLLHTIVRINNIVIDFSRDMWLYISMEYFKLRTGRNEVGSSTMPQKVNPIDFENAEGNVEFANGILLTMASKLQVSRLQRDLSDSTVKRNYGVGLAHSYLALKSLRKGLKKIEPNFEKIKRDLDENWQVLGEAVQTLLRKYGYPEAYEKTLELFKGRTRLTKEEYFNLIEKLEVSAEVKEKLLKLTPKKYIGLSRVLVEKFLETTDSE